MVQLILRRRDLDTEMTVVRNERWDRRTARSASSTSARHWR